MQDVGMSEGDVFAPNDQPHNETDERKNPTAELPVQNDTLLYVERESCEPDKLLNVMDDSRDCEIIDSDVHSSKKRQKIGPQESSTVLEATENSLTDWIGKFENGVRLSSRRSF